MSNPSESEYRLLQARPDECCLLRQLLNAGESFVSGSQLAHDMDLSPPAIWGKIKKLQAFGFEIEAVRNRGYRLVKQPEVIHPALLELAVKAHGMEIPCLYLPVVDSTNNEAERQIANGRRGPFAVISSSQTKGRGRLGREWISASKENLYLTVTYEPRLPLEQLQHFTLWCGIKLCEALQGRLPNFPLKIKWPNDLHYEGQKFAGMLTEAKLDADGLKTLFFGLGLNVNSKPDNLPRTPQAPATSLQTIGGETLPINTIAALALKAIQEAFEICIQNTDTEASLAEAWPPLDSLYGRAVTAELNGKTLAGIAQGIDASGALILETKDGSQQMIRTGDVTLTQF
ncbi:MAG: Bifunctional ligase/repressor BirA [Opitutia bacterium UBA7350]|nr:MAG: Bifunctional ligase/repressor BirA [Opitutae bacterium UBA7350]